MNLIICEVSNINKSRKIKTIFITLVTTLIMVLCFSVGVLASAKKLVWTGSSALFESGQFIEQVTVKAIKLQNALVLAETERDQAISAKNRLEKELEDLRNQSNNNNNTIGRLEQEIIDKNNQIIEKENEIISKNNEIAELTRELETANSQASTLKGQLDSARSKLDEAGINIWN